MVYYTSGVVQVVIQIRFNYCVVLLTVITKSVILYVSQARSAVLRILSHTIMINIRVEPGDWAGVPRTHRPHAAAAVRRQAAPTSGVADFRSLAVGSKRECNRTKY